MLIAVNGIHVNVIDRGEGEAVLFLHGLGLEGPMWWPQVEEFSSRYRCIAIDHRGHGKSDRTYGQYSISGMADDAIGVLDALGVDRVHLVGLSMGGMVAQELVLAHPDRVRTLAVLDSFAQPGEAAAQLDEVGATAVKLGLGGLLGGFEAIMLAPSTLSDRPDLVEGFRETFTSTDPICFARAAGAIGEFSTLERLGEISVPAVVLWGEHDHLTPRERAEELAHGIPGADLEVVPEAGHLSNQENPKAVNVALEGLWSGV